MTPNECHAARYLAADGYSAGDIGDTVDTNDQVVGRHLRDECSCPALKEPRPVPPVDGKKLRAARKDARLTQEELGDVVDISNATISQVERGTVEPSPALRLRLHEWMDEKD